MVQAGRKGLASALGVLLMLRVVLGQSLLDLSQLGWVVSGSLQRSGLNVSASTILLPARVPGTALDALQEAGLIGDPFFASNEAEAAWVAEEAWAFNTTFSMDVAQADLGTHAADLLLQQVDTAADIFLNGELVSRLENAFRPHRLPVKRHLRPGTNQLSIRLLPAPDLELQRQASHPFHVPSYKHMGSVGAYNFLRKPAFQHGWDFGPALPMAGIHGSVVLHMYRQPELLGVHVQQDHSEAATVRLALECELLLPQVPSPGQPLGKVTASLPELGITVSSQVKADAQQAGSQADSSGGSGAAEEGADSSSSSKAVRQFVTLTLSVPRALVELWWPLGYGLQRLYELNVSYQAEGVAACQTGVAEPSEGCTQVSRRVGFRTVELVRLPARAAVAQLLGASGLAAALSDLERAHLPRDEMLEQSGTSFYLLVNGLPVFAKGSNAVPLDIQPSRVVPGQSRRLVQAAAEANMNMIRVWGGGGYGSEELYNAADELGVLIWQDFAFACAPYPVTKELKREVVQEVAHHVRRLGGHASLALWSGNNEVEASFRWFNETRTQPARYLQDYMHMFLLLIPSVLDKLDPGRPYVHGSPSNGQSPQEVLAALKDRSAQAMTLLGSSGEEAAGAGSTQPGPATGTGSAAAAASASKGQQQAAHNLQGSGTLGSPNSTTNGTEFVWRRTKAKTAGDIHWYNYAQDCQDVALSLPRARFVSEFGWQSLASWHALGPTTTSADWTHFVHVSPTMGLRQRRRGGLQEIVSQARRHLTLPHGATQAPRSGSGRPARMSKKLAMFRRWLFTTQLQQGLCYSAAIRYWRSLKSDPSALTMGTLYWQLNDVWPAYSWATLDYGAGSGGRWKGAHYGVRASFAPVVLAHRTEGPEDRSMVHIVSDMPFPLDVELSIEVMRVDMPHFKADTCEEVARWIPPPPPPPKACVEYEAILANSTGSTSGGGPLPDESGGQKRRRKRPKECGKNGQRKRGSKQLPIGPDAGEEDAAPPLAPPPPAPPPPDPDMLLIVPAFGAHPYLPKARVLSKNLTIPSLASRLAWSGPLEKLLSARPSCTVRSCMVVARARYVHPCDAAANNGAGEAGAANAATAAARRAFCAAHQAMRAAACAWASSLKVYAVNASLETSSNSSDGGSSASSGSSGSGRHLSSAPWQWLFGWGGKSEEGGEESGQRGAQTQPGGPEPGSGAAGEAASEWVSLLGPGPFASLGPKACLLADGSAAPGSTKADGKKHQQQGAHSVVVEEVMQATKPKHLNVNPEPRVNLKSFRVVVAPPKDVASGPGGASASAPLGSQALLPQVGVCFTVAAAATAVHVTFESPLEGHFSHNGLPLLQPCHPQRMCFWLAQPLHGPAADSGPRPAGPPQAAGGQAAQAGGSSPGGGGGGGVGEATGGGTLMLSAGMPHGLNISLAGGHLKPGELSRSRGWREVCGLKPAQSGDGSGAGVGHGEAESGLAGSLIKDEQEAEELASCFRRTLTWYSLAGA